LRAYHKAKKQLRKYQQLIKTGYLPGEAIEMIEEQTCRKEKVKQELSILLLGHPYNIYDPYISMNLVDKMQKMGVNTVTPEMIEDKTLKKHWSKLPRNMFWSFGRKTWGSASHFLQNKGVDGIIYLAAFGCGPDSLLGELIERQVRKKEEMPFMLLNIDEHTGEAGIITRLEAFIDMIKWREAQ